MHQIDAIRHRAIRRFRAQRVAQAGDERLIDFDQAEPILGTQPRHQRRGDRAGARADFEDALGGVAVADLAAERRGEGAAAREYGARRVIATDELLQEKSISLSALLMLGPCDVETVRLVRRRSPGTRSAGC